MACIRDARKANPIWGLFVEGLSISEHAFGYRCNVFPGYTLTEWALLDPSTRVHWSFIASRVLEQLIQLFHSGYVHGCIAPKNVIVSSYFSVDAEIQLVNFNHCAALNDFTVDPERTFPGPKPPGFDLPFWNRAGHAGNDLIGFTQLVIFLLGGAPKIPE